MNGEELFKQKDSDGMSGKQLSDLKSRAEIRRFLTIGMVVSGIVVQVE